MNTTRRGQELLRPPKHVFETTREQRDRPTTEPGGMVCECCGQLFIGAEWHSYCAICEFERAALRKATEGDAP